MGSFRPYFSLKSCLAEHPNGSKKAGIMKINKSIFIKTGLVIIYILYFMLMQMLFGIVKNSVNTMMPLSENFYLLRTIKLALIMFSQWFFLGVLLDVLSLKDRPRFHFSIGVFFIAIVWIVMSFMGLFPGYIPFAWFRPEYREFFYYVTPVFSGFFLLKSLLTDSSSRDKNTFPIDIIGS